jgi:hypothetical protein
MDLSGPLRLFGHSDNRARAAPCSPAGSNALGGCGLARALSLARFTPAGNPEIQGGVSNADRPRLDGRAANAPGERIYTFWDYFRNAWGRNAGLRLDHLVLNPPLAQRLTAAEVDREVRSWEKASDHAPVWIELSDAARSARRRQAGPKGR